MKMETQDELDTLFLAFSVTKGRLLISELAEELLLQGSLWGYKINGVETSVELFTASVDAKKTANTKAPFIEELWYYHLLGPKQAKAMRLQVREAA